MPVILAEDKVWFDEQIKLEQLSRDVATSQHNGQSVLVLSHFEATQARIATLLQLKSVRFERFASLNPSDLCSSATARVWLGAARAFRVEQASRASANGAPLQIIVAEHHPLKSQDQQLVDAAGNLGCNGSLCFYFSLDDPLMRRFGANSIQSLFERLGIDKSECVSHRFINAAIANAQEKIESEVGKDVPTYSVEDWFKYNLKK
jgi:preprotein translocase subunit SecA